MRENITFSRFRYRFLLFALWPLLVIFVAWLAIRYRDKQFFFQRMGFSFPQGSIQPIWIHGASVGEVIAATPLVKAIHTQLPHQKILITATTPTGALTARSKLGQECDFCYLPIDWPYAVTAFIKAYQPRCAIIMETEIWPNLYSQIHQHRIPLLIVNARLSPRTLNAPRWILGLYRECLKKVTLILARSQLDADRYQLLGGSSEQIKVVGNIKFSTKPVDATSLTAIIQRPYVLLASTHDDEEKQIAAQWLSNGLGQHHLLVIAPRHPIRRAAIIRDLSPITRAIAVRSQHDKITQQTQIYLADTLGELHNLMAFADVVVMGGSFINHGGQNILEPAQLGKAILTGPSMENFSVECEKLLEAKALVQCKDVNDLTANLQRLLSSEQDRKTLGENAKTIMHQHEQIAEAYLQHIKPYLSR